MPTHALVVFALKEEFAPWRRRHAFRPIENSPHPVFTASFGSVRAFVALCGAGAPDAQNIDSLVGRFRPSLAIVTGVAAGLKPKWRPGDIIVGETVSGQGTRGEFASSPHLIDIARESGAKTVRTLVTLPQIARTVADKIRMGKMADAADMESTILMNYWSARGIPSLALRVILDAVEMPMICNFEVAMDRHGQVQISKIIAQLAARPQLLPGFLRLAGQSRFAISNLARFLDRFFEQLNHIHSTPPPSFHAGLGNPSI